ncbi:MAG: nuclease-related domain-containing protein [Ardenticatenaceae bacterium]
MKIYTNQAVIKRYQKRAIWFSLAGLLVMGVALVLVWTPRYVGYAWPVLIVGMFVALAGTYYVNRWMRPPLPEPVMKEAFGRLDARHVLFHHSHIAPHLLLTPRGLVAIKVKRYEGPVRYEPESGKWTGKFSLRRFYGHGLTAEGLGDPGAEARQLEQHVRGWLQLHLTDIADAIPIEVVILFLSPKTELLVKEPPFPLAQPETLRRVVGALFGKRKPLPRESYKRLRAALESEVPQDAMQPEPAS